MNNSDRCLIIEGHKSAYGTAAPSWWEGDLVDGLGQRPKFTQEVDPLGGIAKIGAAKFSLVDTDRGLSKAIRFANSNRVQVTAPSPLLYDDTALTLDSVTHPTRKALSFPTTGDMRVFPDPAEWDFGESVTYEYWVNIENLAINQYFGRKLTQNGLVFGTANKSLAWVGGPTGISIYWHTTNAMNATGWYHVVASYNHTTGSLILSVNGAQVSHASVPTAGAKPLDAWEQWGVTSATNLMMRGDVARYRVWKRALTAAEISDAYDGKPIDDTSIFFNSEWMAPWQGAQIHDTQKRRHLSIAPGSSWVSRDFLRGDLLHLPRDTARVQSVSGSVATVERQVNSALEDGYCAYYHQEQSNDHVCYAHTDYPHQWEGRLVAYYEGDTLRYVGYIKNMAQRGPSWVFQTESILTPLHNGLKSFGHSLELKEEGARRWYVGTLYLSAPGIDATPLSNVVNDVLSLTELSYECLHQTAGTQWDPPTWWWERHGWTFNELPEIQKTYYDEGVRDVFFSDPEGGVYTRPSGGYTTLAPKSGGVKAYGAILGNNAKIKAEGNNPAAFVGSFLKVKEGALVKVESYSDPWLTLTGTYDDDLNLKDFRTCGISSDDPIQFEIVPVVTASSLTSMVYSLLTSTGAGTNGSYDTFPGLYGMGLPASIVNTALTSALGGDPVTVDLTEGKIADDMQASGCALVFRDGVFKLQRMEPPTGALAVRDIGTEHTLAGERTNLNFGFFHPLKSITYKGFYWSPSAQEKRPLELKIGVQNSNIFFGSTGREKTWKSALKRVITSPVFTDRILKILEWFNNYAPSLNITVPGHALQIGDVVTVSLDDMAGEGDYGVEEVPALVVGLSDDYQVRLVVNTAAQEYGAAWVPSWEIESYSGVTLTLRKGGALSIADGGTAVAGIEDIITLPASMQIITAGGALLNSVTVAASGVSNDTTVVLTGAPTYAQLTYRGILTLQDYTATSVADLIAKYAWAANSSDIMSNSDAGKELS